MVVDGFGSSFGLVWIIYSSLLVSSLVLCGQQLLSSVGNNPCPLWATTLVLCGTTTLVLCGTVMVLCGTHHPLWLPFHLIGWFGLWLRLSFGDSLGQGCEATIWAVWFVWQPSIMSPLMN
jgi:hypothetical protein